MDKADLLKKFLNNACNEQEAELAMQYLEQEPELLDALLNKSEWDEIDASKPLVPGLQNEIKRKIYRKTYKTAYRFLKPVFASAAMFAAIFFGILYINDSGNLKIDNDPYITKAQDLPTNKIENLTGEIKIFPMDDNSVVHLYPNSSIIYKTAFTANRQIHLKGKAVFFVTKNPESPFVVHSGEISTTALGTQFLVDNSQDIKKINVKLFEGRVVVRSNEASLQIQETFLEAGQQCFVDINNMLVKVETIITSGQLAQKKSSTTRLKVISHVSKQIKNLEYIKMPIPGVLNNLQAVFGRKIYFNEEEIADNLLTGTFSQNDSLISILRMIAEMNDLQIDLKGDSINISKKPVNIPRDSKVSAGKASTIDNKNSLQSKMPSSLMPPSLLKIDNIILLQGNKVSVGENSIQFTGISLPGLLDELQKQTKRKIYFNEEELKHINFTGSIPFKSSVGSTLSALCTSNGLKLTVKNKSYYISKNE